jgi:alpha-mannosidase
MNRIGFGIATFLLGSAIVVAQVPKIGSAKKPTGGPATKPAAAARALRPSAPPDLTKRPTLYVVAYAHLDTQWRWEYPQVISEYLTKTMRNNFEYFEKYPHYIFNFTGANRYRLMKEYFPADFARLKQYVAAGRWFPAGSSMEEGDVNAPSAEAIIRQVLYGNNWFRKEFGKASQEFMLPDCFGFPSSLPTILAHAGIKGFSTQKLSAAWQPAPHVGGPDSPEKTPEGIPFNVGVWEGPDGSTILAALNPLSYTSDVTYDLSKTPPPLPPVPANAPPNFRPPRPFEDWTKRLAIDGTLTGVYADYHYVGTGDTGGAPTENSIKLMEAIETRAATVIPPLRYNFGGGRMSDVPPGPNPPMLVGDGPVHVMWSNADQMFLDVLKCCNKDRMPRYKGDLELINHSAGSLTSQAYHKRWNRENELLAAAAEESSVAAEWMGGRKYPLQRLSDAWALVMGGHFHDNMAGTSTPKAYEFVWNDDVIAMNQFAGVLASATAAIASGMDTQGNGTAIIAFNPLNVAREDVVEATLPGAAQSVRVVGPDGKEVPAQTSDGRVVFVAKAPSVGYAVYEVESGASSVASDLKVSESSLENARYRVQIDANGDVSGIFDKKLNRELLSGPIRLAISTDNPRQWPAWNMDFEDEQRPPRAYVSGAAKVRVVENGPARVGVEITRDTEGSHFVQTVRLSAGDAANRVEFANAIDWNTKEANLKAVFPLAAKNQNATYNWDIGTIQRPNEFERQFEVASHQWIDLADQSGKFGVTILTDCKNASDKPNDNTLRLTLVRTPGTRGGYPDQGSQDLGHHEFVFGLAGHDGDYRRAQTDWQAYRLNQPLAAFQSAKHSGPLGKQFSLLKLSSDRVRLLALKKAELSDEVIVRIVELDGRTQRNVGISFAGAIASAREVNGQEQPVGGATVSGGMLTTILRDYQPRTFAIKLGAASTKLAAPTSQPVELKYDLAAATTDGHPAEGSFDILPNNPASAQGRALPAEILPRDIEFSGIHFKLAPAGGGRLNAVTAKGQTLPLPRQRFNRVYVLAAGVGDQRGTFQIGGQGVPLNIQNWTGFVGQWDDRTWNERQEAVQPRPGQTLPPNAPRVRTVQEFSGILVPGFIKRADIAWCTSHRHGPDGTNEPYQYAYLFAYPIDVPAGATAITLPDNDRIRILAISVADESGSVAPVQPLYDTLERTEARKD